MLTILSVFGTRPEAIKMAPVIKVLASYPDKYRCIVCVTAQHRQMLDQVLCLFGIRADYDLDIMKPGQNLFDVTINVLNGLQQVLKKEQPDIVLVHGDTTTTMAASLAAFYCQIRIGHVEAGLRTGNKCSPYPEEINRKVTGVLTDIHFAPTAAAKANLLREGVAPAAIYVTGNTVIDALLEVAERLKSDVDLQCRFDQSFSFLDDTKRLILVTSHRRENFGEGFENICRALMDIVAFRSDVEILYPVHLNPNVHEPAWRLLSGNDTERIHLVEPVDYLPFVYLMNRSYLIITDSGGVQEEAPSLGKPVLVMRETTERPEAVEAGTVKLVGVDREKIVRESLLLLDNRGAYTRMSMAHNPYGDGKAAERIEAVIARITASPSR